MSTGFQSRKCEMRRECCVSVWSAACVWRGAQDIQFRMGGAFSMYGLLYLLNFSILTLKIYNFLNIKSWDSGSGRYPGEGNGNPLKYSCLENPMDRGARQATVYCVTRVGHDLVTKPPPNIKLTY